MEKDEGLEPKILEIISTCADGPEAAFRIQTKLGKLSLTHGYNSKYIEKGEAYIIFTEWGKKSEIVNIGREIKNFLEEEARCKVVKGEIHYDGPNRIEVQYKIWVSRHEPLGSLVKRMLKLEKEN